jgi:hypothetical protein
MIQDLEVSLEINPEIEKIELELELLRSTKSRLLQELMELEQL